MILVASILLITIELLSRNGLTTMAQVFDIEGKPQEPYPSSDISNRNVTLYQYQYIYTSPSGPIQIEGPEDPKICKNLCPIRKTIWIAHGWKGGANNTNPQMLLKAFMSKKDEFFNLFMLDYKELASADYGSFSGKLSAIADIYVPILQALVDKCKLQLKNLHIVGHSAGCQIAAFIGKRFQGRIGKLTGLDCAGPNFEGKPESERINRNDTLWNEAYHCSDDLGIKRTVAQRDFYVNGGVQQPTCAKSFGILKSSCNHNSCVSYYANSITSNTFLRSATCSNATQARDAKATKCAMSECVAGYNNDCSPGIYHVTTY